MPSKKRQDPITGTIKQPWGIVVIGGFGFFGTLMFMAIFLPVFSEFYFYISLSMGVIGIIGFWWINASPNLWAKLLGFISIACLFMIIAIRSFTYLLPEMATIITFSILATTVIAHILPILNLTATLFIKRELSFTPQTRIGKSLLKISLMLLPIGGFLGASVGLFTRGGNDNISYVMVLLGPICWLLAVILPFSTEYPISPWEYKRKR